MQFRVYYYSGFLLFFLSIRDIHCAFLFVFFEFATSTDISDLFVTLPAEIQGHVGSSLRVPNSIRTDDGVTI